LVSKENRLLVSVGIGFDVSYDEALQGVGFKIIAIDPSPSCIKFAQSKLGKDARFITGALLPKNRSEIFTFRNGPGDDSFTTVPAPMKSSFSESTDELNPVDFDQILNEAWCKDSDIRVLKMDIEGAELFIFDDLIRTAASWNLIQIEFDCLANLRFFEIRRRLRNLYLSRQFILAINSTHHLCRSEHFNLHFHLN
jgi:FkbM family methyltransferase